MLSGKLTPDQVQDRIVLIGVVAQSAHDYSATPYSTRQGVYQEMSGVIVQAQLVSQILSAAKDGRPLLKFWTLSGDLAWIGFWAVAGGMVAVIWCAQSKSAPKAPIYLILAAVVAIGALYLLCFLWLLHGIWVPLVPSIMAFLGTGGSLVVGHLSRSRTFILSEMQK